MAGAVAGALPALADLEKLADAVVETAGGAERLGQLGWERVEDSFFSHPADALGNQAKVTTSLRRDGSLKVFFEYPSGDSEQRVMLHREEFLQPRMSSSLAIATGGRQQYVEWDWESSRLPVILLEAERLEPLPTRVEEGRTLVGMKVTIPEMNPPFEVWIDLAGPVIAELSTDLPLLGDLSPNGWAKHQQFWSDYRFVDGVLFPFRRDTWVEGRRSVLAETRSLRIGAQFEDSFFVPDDWKPGDVPTPPPKDR